MPENKSFVRLDQKQPPAAAPQAGHAELPAELRPRVVIDRVGPEVDAGRFPVKRVVGDVVVVEADILCDGHEELDCRLQVRQGTYGEWQSLPMACQGNDRWQGSFSVTSLGWWHFDISARIDTFGTWLRDLGRREEVGERTQIDLAVGAELVLAAARGAPEAIQQELEQLALKLQSPAWASVASSDRLRELMASLADRREETHLEQPRSVWVDRERASWSAWYEVFPRSWGLEPGRHGTFADLADRLDYVHGMGFNVLYLTPIHPIGRSFRKGRNNATTAAADDVGSPWAIGAAEGGHTAIHPELGTWDDFQSLRSRAEELGMELALDLAVQCAPDHPWVKEHPEWFRQRPDGSIQYAENPPKKYQDIVPFDFECDAWRELWQALGGVVRFWVAQGVRIFRVDNPHTKPFAFWEWLINDIHRTAPDVLFLAEAFTRPKTMYRLAKLGFSQSYTYFTWRTEKEETAAYLVEVSTPPVAEFFRPNFWPNTPDILHATLHSGSRGMFQVRLTLAALSVGNWGIYGPAMELLESQPVKPGSEEYADSEKYEIKQRALDRPESLAPFIARLNAIRAAEPACRSAAPPLIQALDNPHLLAWCRYEPAEKSRVLVVVNLDPDTPSRGQLRLDRKALELDQAGSIEAIDLLTQATHLWPLEGIDLDCTPAEPVRLFRLIPR